MSVVYPSLDAFFTDRGLRRAREMTEADWLEDSHDYGVDWRDRLGGIYRLTWLGTTHRAEGDGGELYLVRLNLPTLTLPGAGAVPGSASGGVEFLCVIAPVTDWVTRRHNPAENVEAILDGWAEVCGEPNSTDWVRDRAREAQEAGWATET